MTRSFSLHSHPATSGYAARPRNGRLGQKSEALQAVTRALQLRPDFPEALQLVQVLSR